MILSLSFPMITTGNPNGRERRSCISKLSSEVSTLNDQSFFNYQFHLSSYFDKGKCWEKGVPLCKELANFYETNLYDYNKLSDVLTTEAKFFQNVLTQIRPEPEYFRVGFFGKGFPLFVRVSIAKFLEYSQIIQQIIFFL